MFLTETDFENMKISADEEISWGRSLANIIEEDMRSPEKQRMLEGERYYAGEHDILKKRFDENYISESYIDADGSEKERRVAFRNPNRSNHHNVNLFHKILVEQKVSYLTSREPGVWVRGADGDADLMEYERRLSEFCNDKFNITIQELITGAANKGKEAVHFYYDKDGKLDYCIVPATELIPIYDSEHQSELLQVIRYYDICLIENGRTKLKRRIELWDRESVTYFIEADDGSVLPDYSAGQNTMPHWFESTAFENGGSEREEHGWGRPPFIIMTNNLKGTSDLQGIKGLIDAYDIISSEGTNNFIDLVDLYWVIEGYGAETASAVAKKLKINKAVHVLDSSGKVEARQVELPVAGRLEFLKMLKEDIFLFGQGIDTDNEKFGSAPSGVSLKFRYLQLDLKAGALMPRLKKAIRDMLWFFTEDLNRREGRDFECSLAEISINKTMITNDLETVNMINLSKELLSEKTLLSKHPFVDDVNAEAANVPRKGLGNHGDMQTD